MGENYIKVQVFKWQKVYNLLRTFKGYFLKKNIKFNTLNGLKSRIIKKVREPSLKLSVLIKNLWKNVQV